MTDSTDETLPAVHTAFVRLARENPGLTDIDRKIMRVFEQLMLGRPEITDGQTSAVDICAEAGVSRASYYRSPVAAVIKGILSSPKARRPESDELRQEITRLKVTVPRIEPVRHEAPALSGLMELLEREPLVPCDLRRVHNELFREHCFVEPQPVGTDGPTAQVLEGELR
ncbi:hypothetical protein GCM10010254_53290 [Streptomyces chromofuscus]|nr:hypothetical protein GCM10010254_53290 [Streptomyces chromofuscus]